MKLDQLFLKNVQAQVNHRTQPNASSKTRQQTDVILRDVAFVLKMTQQIRAEMKMTPTTQETVAV